jgi:hypothetical protein
MKLSISAAARCSHASSYINHPVICPYCDSLELSLVVWSHLLCRHSRTVMIPLLSLRDPPLFFLCLTSLLMTSSPLMLHSDSTPTFSSSSHTYSTPDTWDTPPPSPTVVSEFPDTVPAHPLNILPHVAPEPFSLESLMWSWPYDSHRFTSFHPYWTDTDDRKLHLTACPHMTHAHTLKHKTFCFEHVCPTHYPYGNNRRTK